MKNKVSVNWMEDMAFEATVNDHKIKLDAVEAVGGKNRGPRPKPLLLVSLGGCTGMDVVSMLKKMRVEYESFDMDVEADMTEEHPKYYNKIKITYKFRGKDLPKEKLEKAVTLSQERYCGVTAMLSKAAEIDYEIIIED
ncbi:MAG: OsmC family protein [Bacteroidales bacterium]|nr:OsmC family protein [Bacteroidales bacterium]